MTALLYALLILHFIGLAAIAGPFLDRWRRKSGRVTTVMAARISARDILSAPGQRRSVALP